MVTGFLGVRGRKEGFQLPFERTANSNPPGACLPCPTFSDLVYFSQAGLARPVESTSSCSLLPPSTPQRATTAQRSMHT